LAEHPSVVTILKACADAGRANDMPAHQRGAQRLSRKIIGTHNLAKCLALAARARNEKPQGPRMALRRNFVSSRNALASPIVRSR